MIFNLKTKYINELAKVRKGNYGDWTTALELFSEDGELLCIATVALDVTPDEGNVLIKNWSENEGVLQALIRAGVISTPIREHRTGYVAAQECKLLVDLD